MGRAGLRLRNERPTATGSRTAWHKAHGARTRTFLAAPQRGSRHRAHGTRRLWTFGVRLLAGGSCAPPPAHLFAAPSSAPPSAPPSAPSVRTSVRTFRPHPPRPPPRRTFRPHPEPISTQPAARVESFRARCLGHHSPRSHGREGDPAIARDPRWSRDPPAVCSVPNAPSRSLPIIECRADPAIDATCSM